jgi:Protein of unknown function (DUF992)
VLHRNVVIRGRKWYAKVLNHTTGCRGGGRDTVRWASLAQGEPAPAKQVTKIGYLSCHVASGWEFIFGSSRKLDCTYTPRPGD